MKFFIPFLLLIVTSADLNQNIYNFKLKNLNNRTVSYQDLKGENLTVIDFWATWCKPCLQSIPKLVDMSHEFEDQGVKFIGVSVDGPRNLNKVRPFAKSAGIDYPVLLDTDNSVMGRVGVRAVPSLLIVNSNDEIVYFHEGYAPGEDKMIREEIQNNLIP